MKYFNNGKVFKGIHACLNPAVYFFIRMVKVTICLILVFSLGGYASGNAQEVTLNVKNKTLKEVFAEIRKQTDYHFLYDETVISKFAPVSITVKSQPVDKVLTKLLDERKISYEKQGNTILLLNKHPVKRHTSRADVEVSGIVTDSSGTVLQGVSIVVKEHPQIGTSTDINGRFILVVPEQSTLLFRYIGYISQELEVSAGTNLEIIMLPDATGLEEVVVIGFGQQKKESLVSSVSSVKGEQLRMPTRSLSNNLAGQIPGLIAVQRSGEPGYDDAEFWIRGVSSFAGGTRPLVLVDGVPRNMNDIEPDEIETFTLLKDAAATSVYGSEGANGVILITSKRGKVQRTAISYRGEVSRLTPTRVPRLANSFDYLSLYNEALRNEGKPPVYSDEVLAKYASGEDSDLYPNSNWWDILMKDHTYNTRHTLNFRGGNERARFFVSGAYFGESGLYKVNNEFNNNAGLNRYNLRSNVDIDVTKSTLLRIDLSGQYLETNNARNASNAIFERISRIPPHLFPAIYSDGTLAEHPSYTGNKRNPYNYLTETGYRKQWRTGIQSRVDLEQKLDWIAQGLKIRGAASYDANTLYEMSRTKVPDAYFAEGRDEEGNLIFRKITNYEPFGEPAESSSGDKNIYLETSLNFDRTFANHTVNAMALYYQKEQQLHNEALAFRKQAYVGRLAYSFDNRYSIEANFGVTGSEQFAAGYRYGFFPAVGVAWNLANEPYFPESLQHVVNSFKLRASIGRTGNDNTGGSRFMYRPTFANGDGYSLGIGSTGAINGINGNGLVEGRFAAPSLSWEIELKRNYGIDVALWNGQVTLQADYFDNLRTDILLQRRTVSEVAGFRQAPWQNYGKVENKGIDGSINVNKQIGEVTLGVRGNVTFARNKILEYDEIPQAHEWMSVTGKRLNALSNLLVAERLFTDDDFHITTDDSGNAVYELKDGIARQTYVSQVMPGDIKYVDLNNDGVIDDFDRVRDSHHPLIPELMYGFGVSVGYKGFYFNGFFQGAGNVSVNLNNQANAFMPFHWGIEESNVRQEIVESRWTPEDPSQNVFFPRLRVTEMANTNTASTWWVRDGSFIRLKNVELGYSLNKPLFAQRIQAARLYLMGQNVALWDKVKMYDPEIGNSAGGTRYPIPSIWTFGLEFTL